MESLSRSSTCPRMSGYAAKAAKKAGAEVFTSGTYVAIEGPQFSTRAESQLFREWGAHVIGMTAMPEARLAREAELPYALLGMVTDYDCWRDEQADVDVTDILSVMRANADTARQTLREFASVLPKTRRASPIDTVLDTAIITTPEQWDRAAGARLDAVAGRLLPIPVPEAAQDAPKAGPAETPEEPIEDVPQQGE